MIERLLRHRVAELEAQVDLGNDPLVDPWSVPRDPGLFPILRSVARMDDERSHGLLAEILACSQNTMTRADVLEAMASEDRMFELDLVLGCLEAKRPEPEVLSALYALYCKGIDVEPEVVAPYLSDPSVNVRAIAVEALQNAERHRPTITRMLDDPHERVRRAAGESLAWLDELGQ